MAFCPECDSTLAVESDIEFEEVDASLGFVRASKRYYVAKCADCGRAIGSGVAGAKGNAGAGAAGAGD